MPDPLIEELCESCCRCGVSIVTAGAVCDSAGLVDELTVPTVDGDFDRVSVVSFEA